MAPKRKYAVSSASAETLKRPATTYPDEDDDATLTVSSLKNHTEVHQHIENFQKGKITAKQLQEYLGNKQMQTVWKNFEYHRNNHPDAKKQWDEICQLKRGDQKDSKKRMLLFAWLKEKKFGNHYFQKAQALNVSRKQDNKLTWMTWKELTEKHGEAEAKARVKAGTVLARKDPKDNRFWQFLGETESQTLSVEQLKSLKVENAGKLKASHGLSLAGSMQGHWDLEDARDLWTEDRVDTGGFDFADLQDDDEGTDVEGEGTDDEGLSKFLNNPSSSSNEKHKKGKPEPSDKNESFNKKLSVLSQIEDGDSQDKALRKLSTMHSILSKQELSLRMAKTKGTGADAKKFNTIHSNVQKNIEVIGKMVETKPKIAIIKKALLSAASTSKAAREILSARK